MGDNLQSKWWKSDINDINEYQFGFVINGSKPIFVYLHWRSYVFLVFEWAVFSNLYQNKESNIINCFI